MASALRSAPAGERDLPVRRLPGEGKDSVFAFQKELERWQRSDAGHAAAETGPALQHNRRRFLAAGSTLVLVGLAACAIWIVGWPGRLHQPGSDPQRPVTRARASEEPEPVVLPSVQLDISRPDGWKVTLSVPDGGVAQIGGSPGHPPLILRPRVAPVGLILEIARADGQPMKDQGSGAQPMVLLLDRNVTVQVRQPYRFSVRWLDAAPPQR